MTADIVELEIQLNTEPNRCGKSSNEVWVALAETYEAFGSDICRGKTTRRLVRVDDEPRGAILNVVSAERNLEMTCVPLTI